MTKVWGNCDQVGLLGVSFLNRRRCEALRYQDQPAAQIDGEKWHRFAVDHSVLLPLHPTAVRQAVFESIDRPAGCGDPGLA